MTWGWTAILALILLLGGGLYIHFRWQRSPMAYRAMIAIAVCFLTAGVLLGAWLFHSRADASGAAPIASIEVVPGKLKVRIFLRDFPTEPGKRIQCWSYISEGFSAYRQKEILFTLRRPQGQKIEDYPRDFLRLLSELFADGHGKSISNGSHMLWDTSGAGGQKEFSGVAFVDANDPAHLDAIGLLGDEPEIAARFGLTRVLGLLGNRYRIYPYPSWSDPSRAPVATLNDESASILAKTRKIAIQGSFFAGSNRVFISLSPMDWQYRSQIFTDLATNPLALMTTVDPRADSCLVWPKGAHGPTAIAAPGSKGSRMTGNFASFIPAPNQAMNELLAFEDGYFINVTQGAWDRIQAALVAGADITVPGSKPGEASIVIEWRKDTYTSPITRQSYFTAAGWWDYTPEIAFEPASAGPLVFTSVVILNGISQATDSLVDYNRNFRDTLDLFFTQPDHKMNCKFAFRLEFAPGKKAKVMFATDRALAPREKPVAQAMYDALVKVPAPIVTDPFAMEFQFHIRDAAKDVRQPT